jgi:predicted P-loop ATPase
VASLWGRAHEIGFRLEKRFLADCLEVEALRNEVHPVRNYFAQLKWDGIKRLDRWCSTYLGAPDNDYVQAVGSKILIAGVRRIRKPGTKFDQMVIFEGKQGTGKSSAIKILAIKEEWFTDGVSLTNDAKVLMEQTEGKLIVEIPELKGLKKSDIEHVKATLSRTNDRARKAYGHFTDEAPRQFIMFGSVNIDARGECWYLTDPTGNRRFWPIRTGNIDLESLTQDLDQLWAEAVVRERAGESIELPVSLWRVAEMEQQGRTEVDPWVEELRVHFADMEGENLKILIPDARQMITRNLQSWRAYDDDRLGRAMRELGFDRRHLRLKGEGRFYHYVRGSGPWKRVRVYVDSNSTVRVSLTPEADLDD